MSRLKLDVTAQKGCMVRAFVDQQYSQGETPSEAQQRLSVHIRLH